MILQRISIGRRDMPIDMWLWLALPAWADCEDSSLFAGRRFDATMLEVVRRLMQLSCDCRLSYDCHFSAGRRCRCFFVLHWTRQSKLDQAVTARCPTRSAGPEVLTMVQKPNISSTSLSEAQLAGPACRFVLRNVVTRKVSR